MDQPKTLQAALEQIASLEVAATKLATDHKAALDEKATELAEANFKVTDLSAKLETANKGLADKSNELVAANATIAELKAKDATVAQRAAELAASQGIPPLAVGTDKAASVDHLAEYRRLRGTDPVAAAEFYAKNRDKILT